MRYIIALIVVLSMITLVGLADVALPRLGYVKVDEYGVGLTRANKVKCEAEGGCQTNSLAWLKQFAQVFFMQGFEAGKNAKSM
jgi:hypothetical protein